MKHTIIYFIGVYDTLDLFTGKLREAFETMGYASFVYDARLPQSKGWFHRFLCLRRAVRRSVNFHV